MLIQKGVDMNNTLIIFHIVAAIFAFSAYVLRCARERIEFDIFLMKYDRDDCKRTHQ